MSAWRVSHCKSKVRIRLVLCATSVLGMLACLLFGFTDGVRAQKKEAAPVTCATCHAGVAHAYAGAPMRHALEPANANPTLNAHPNLTAQMGRFTYRVQTTGGQSTYTVSDETGSLTLPIHWVFGQHSQTFVLEKDGHLYESLVTYFPRESALATTPGDEVIKPTTLQEAMGRQLSTWETLSCFNCHATNAIQGTHLTLDKLILGIECERCHEGAQKHMADAVNDNFKSLPRPLKRMSTQQASDFCGQCHRTWETVVRNHWRGPAFVRFQPYRLQNSKCYAADDPRISCFACHDPHQQVNHSQAYYDTKCLACHSGAKVEKSTGTSASAKACPVAKKDCATCHMPKVELPGGHALFTDHQIRIVRPGDPYPN